MAGWIEVIAGSMYSGKTEELIRRVRRAEFAKLKTQVFKPALDNRYHATHVASHDQNQIQAIALGNIQEVWSHLSPHTRVVGFDEAQFFSKDIVDICRELSKNGMRVIVAGLDMDWRGQPFEPMPTLMAIAEDVTKPRAICTSCGELATYTQKLGGSADRVQIGANDFYEARCRRHFKPEIEALDLAPLV